MRWPWHPERPVRRTEDVVTAALVEVRTLVAELKALAEQVDKAGESDV